MVAGIRAWVCFVTALFSLLWGGVVCPPALPRRNLAPPEAEALAFPLDGYQQAAFLHPVWEGSIAYQESVIPLESRDGGMPDIPLLYDADEILSVRSNDLQTEYVQGVDYALADGKLRILDGAIPRVPHMKLYPLAEIEVQPGALLFPGGGESPYIYCQGGMEIPQMQLSVTYRHSDAYRGQIPLRQGSRLPKTLAKLEAGEPLRILFYGDSITVGAQSSGWCGEAPFVPAYYDLVAAGLQAQYQSAVAVINPAVSGTASAWGAENAQELAADQHPDLAVIAFGMNDGSIRIPPAVYFWNTLRILSRIRAANPDCEFVLVATTVPNPAAPGFCGTQDAFRPWLWRLAQRGTAVADMTQTHRNLLERKRFEDMTSNNVNHPNDYLARIQAQVILETLLP
ncbi:MAG: SGNH/GDSL hydrolase family protein [Oscillospiraceae bacterium]|nr:SGNH/GDSL hydrolase family protein [Oscillospiraceae bacterium]